ncbi:oxygen-independent coproporphyrinogen III oxidase [Dokdonella sp.]|uniref:oxygen-independent coproporphyrinogen III oxidase n=1 Tax=Dokdonella sp. TaxID=2291710 RepID=UPI002D1306B7|nr:oxygen-independent coproporphyrinogen III oxidase [Dokdonella sp.]HOX72873.1 oxygen-independent coproporphyrinogen III oxidase [Dokdonella sp.]HPN80748.1 oxygen-independent coproporphyrinogen III oxidase [Dokdonella sp.]
MNANTLIHPVLARAPVFDAELIARHNVNGPRYTSYPTAPHFNEQFSEEDLRAIVRASNEDPIPHALSIYVHIPFCLSPCFYCGCTRIITRDRRRADQYLARLLREIAMTAPLFDRDRRVNQLHLGGGTPNFLDATQMTTLLDALRNGFNLSTDAEREFGIEVDPRHADAATVRMLADVGFNRMSLGIQDFDAEVQLAVNRVQSIEQTREVIVAARESGFRSVSVDLIHGLPKQTTEKFARTLDEVIALRPDRIATYAYAHMPSRFRAQNQIKDADLPDAATRLALIGQTVSTLGAAGYRYIGLDHFALPDDDLARAQREGTMQRNFQGYSTHGDCDLIGLGMSSIGHIGRSFHQNARDLLGYYAAIDAGHLPMQRGKLLDDDDVIRADVIQRLMCHGELDMRAFGEHHGIAFREYFPVEMERIDALQADGLVVVTADRLTITARGRFLLRIVAMCFDAYLDAAPDGARPTYSKAL